MILSRNMLKRVGESRHPCRTPNVVQNQSPMLPLKKTSGLVTEVFDDLDKVYADVVLFHGWPQSCIPSTGFGMHGYSFTSRLPLLTYRPSPPLIYLRSTTAHLPALCYYSFTIPLPLLIYMPSTTSSVPLSLLIYLPLYHCSSTVLLPLLIYSPYTTANLSTIYRCSSTCPLPLLIHLPSTTVQ